MKIPSSNNKFEICPEFRGPAVCVGVSPSKMYQTKAGELEMFTIKFRVDSLDGSSFLVWSSPFTLTRKPSSPLAQFLESWFGHALTNEWWDAFDTDQLIGRRAQIVVVHKQVNGRAYANIKQIMPYEPGKQLKSSGKIDQIRDTETTDDANNARQDNNRSQAEPPATDGNDHDVPF